MALSDQDELLSILEAHGRQFLNSFPSNIVTGKRSSSEKAHKRKKHRLEEEAPEGLDEEEEWTGFSENESKEDEDEDEAMEQEGSGASSPASN